MITDYFRTLTYSKSETERFYRVKGANTEFLICAFKDRDSGKSEIINALKRMPEYRHLNAGDFDFHHIVEKQHMADISFLGELERDYQNFPTAMIHKKEHKERYNSILHTKETRLLYMRDAINPVRAKQNSSVIRQTSTIQLFGNGLNPAGMQELRSRINILKEIYWAAYEGNDVFRIISRNILNKYDRSLNLL
ncbi:MAG TPA: hypothetical protein VF939_21755 [Puia sp.]